MKLLDYADITKLETHRLPAVTVPATSQPYTMRHVAKAGVGMLLLMALLFDTLFLGAWTHPELVFLLYGFLVVTLIPLVWIEAASEKRPR